MRNITGGNSLHVLELKELKPSDVTQAYVDWMNDAQVLAYTEQRFTKHTMDDVRAFVEAKLKSQTEYLYGIFVDGSHVGNIKIGPINETHGTADISYIIGVKSLWGKGVATQAIMRVVEIARGINGVRKLTAGVYRVNTGSAKALVKNGFELEGTRKQQYRLEDATYTDGLLYGLIL